MTETPTDPIETALREDIGGGDITTEFFVPDGLVALGRIIARERAIVAGGQTAAEVFRRVNPSPHVDVLQPDGAALIGGEGVLGVRGQPRPRSPAQRAGPERLPRPTPHT